MKGQRERSGRSALRFAAALLALLVAAPHAVAQDEVTLEPGRFLVASRELRDSNFRETVVLIVEYDPRGGALGLIVNSPTEVLLSQVFPDLEGGTGDEPVFRGGPVDPMQVTLLVRSDDPEADGARPAQHVFEDVYFSNNRGLIEWMVRAPEVAGSLRSYAGYAGWSPGQLEAEIAVGGWHVMRGEPEAIFEEPSAKVWPRLILRGTAEWASLRHGRP
jgi:putative transcriptional regulator